MVGHPALQPDAARNLWLWPHEAMLLGMMVRTVNIRALKDRLSAYLRDVQRGDVLLVSDRGRVVAELRTPSMGAASAAVPAGRRQMLIDEGWLRPGLPHATAVYQPATVHLPAESVDRVLAFIRGEP